MYNIYLKTINSNVELPQRSSGCPGSAVPHLSTQTLAHGTRALTRSQTVNIWRDTVPADASCLACLACLVPARQNQLRLVCDARPAYNGWHYDERCNYIVITVIVLRGQL